MSERLCLVAVEGATPRFDIPYSYLLPQHLNAVVGAFCMVPFGAGTRPRLGIILQITYGDGEGYKTVMEVCEPRFALDSGELALCEFIKEQYICGFFHVVNTVIPTPFLYKIQLKDNVYRLSRRKKRETAPPEVAPAKLSQPLTLSPAQQEVFKSILPLALHPDKKPALLYGVTASGKTAIFIKLIEQMLLQDKSVLLLLPEISLATQMAKRMKQLFGEGVALVHSALSDSERATYHVGIKNGSYRIVIGTRTAMFAPMQNLGLIIMDEEQDASYSSDRTPRFSTHTVAGYVAKRQGALLLLASATPSITTYYFAQKGFFHYFELNTRYNDIPLPTAVICDLRQDRALGNVGAVSDMLKQDIEQNISDGKQTILLLNRRGYRTAGVCEQCRSPKTCRNCSVPMVLHKSQNRLLCHYCGAQEPAKTSSCDKCGGALSFTGAGTEHIEDELAQRFPGVGVIRMDTDVVAKKDSHEQLLSVFSERQADILVGTQMVAKGLDFEDVTLVGVLGIDSMLYACSYRAFETVFSLITQVVGRSGRTNGDGRAVIETSDPKHHVILLAAKQDYKTFYKQELSFRNLSLYPPFCSLIVISFVAKTATRATEAALVFRSLLTERHSEHFKNQPIRVLGPAPYNVAIVNQKHRVKLTLKCKNSKTFRDFLRYTMSQMSQKKYDNGVEIFIDFNSREE